MLAGSHRRPCFSLRVLFLCTMTSSNGNILRVTGPLCGNSPVTGEIPSQRLVTRNFGVFVDLHLNKRLGKQSRRWWFETQSGPLWRHSNAIGNRASLCVCYFFAWKVPTAARPITLHFYIIEMDYLTPKSVPGTIFELTLRLVHLLYGTAEWMT